MLDHIMLIFDKLRVPRWLVSIIGMKIIYQIVYIVFSLIIVKKLAVAEYGFYSYVVALIVYFSTIPLLGFPIYLQRNVALENGLSHHYFAVVTVLMSLSIISAFLVMPNMLLSQQVAVTLIILINCFITILVSIHDGIGKYSFQYKLFFLTNIWMILLIFQSFFFNQQMTFNLLLNYWLVNSILVLLIGIVIFMRLTRGTISLTKEGKFSYSFIFADLFLLFAVGIPDNFARFYDKFLGNQFFDHTFLGNYSFNLMAVMAIYALFIRPINSVLFTQMVKMHQSPNEYINLIKKYYLYGIAIYVFFYIMYVPFSTQILTLLGLSKYIGTIGFFKFSFLNAILYLISIPFTNLIALSENKRKKLIYCILSLLIFNLPLLLIWWRPIELHFFVGFILAYMLNFLLCIVLEYKVAMLSFSSMIDDISKAWAFIRLAKVRANE